MPESLPVPDGLEEPGARFWADMTTKFDFEPHELVLLETACSELDLCRRLERAVRELPDIRTKGSMGQAVAAPEVSELRQHSLALASLLARLKLDGADPKPARTGNERSDQARSAARARWDRPVAAARKKPSR